MKEKIYTAAILGCGRIGSLFSQQAKGIGSRSHAEAFRAHPRIQLVGVADSDASRAQAAGTQWQVPYETDPLLLCRQLNPDIVSVCTPDDTHFSLAEKILRSNAPRLLFMEKPLASHSGEARALLQLAKEKNCAVQVNYSRRFSPAFQQLRENLQGGIYGKPLLVNLIYGKGLLHNGTHAIDFLRFLFGEPSAARSLGSAWGPGTDSTHSFEMQFASGLRAFAVAFDERDATVFEVDIFTDRFRFRLLLGGGKVECYSLVEGAIVAGYKNYIPDESLSKKFDAPMRDCLAGAVENIVHFLDGSSALLCSGEDALQDIIWAEKIAGQNS